MKKQKQLELFPKSGVKESTVGDEDLYPVRPNDLDDVEDTDDLDDMGISSMDFGDQ